MYRKLVIVALACTLGPSWLAGDVVDSAANGFTIKVVTTIHAAPADVYGRLIRNIGDWWHPEHTFSGDAHNLSIEERPMGCFCEKLGNQGAVRHMEVVFFVPGKTLRLSGALGPLQGLGATGALTFSLTPAGDSTRLEMTYAATGYTPQGMNTWAAPVNAVWTEQITRLKNYVETGNPAPLAGRK